MREKGKQMEIKGSHTLVYVVKRQARRMQSWNFFWQCYCFCLSTGSSICLLLQLPVVQLWPRQVRLHAPFVNPYCMSEVCAGVMSVQ